MYKEYTARNRFHDNVRIREYPPQKRSIRIAWYDWYDDDPEEDGLLICKKAFRLWFPRLMFVFLPLRLSLAFKINRKLFFPTLPNVFYDNRLCLDCGENFDQAIEDFWNSEFWESINDPWPGTKILSSITRKPEEKAYETWEQWSLKQTKEMLSSENYEYFADYPQSQDELIARA